MAIFVHSTSGNDSWPGNNINYPVASLAQAITNLPLYSPHDLTIIIQDTATYYENITVNLFNIIGNVYSAHNFEGPVIAGAANTDPAITVEGSCCLEGLVIEPEIANKIGIKVTELAVCQLDTVYGVVVVDGVVLLDLDGGVVAPVSPNFFVFGAPSVPNARLVRFTSDTLPSTLKGFIFGWDSVNSYGAENCIVQDNVGGGSKNEFINCMYVDLDVDAEPFTLRTIYADRDTHPTNASNKDPYPISSFSYRDIVLPTDNDVVADTVWDEAKSEHISDGSFGKVISDIDADIDQSLSVTEANITGDAGDTLETISDQLDSAQSSITDILSDTNEIQSKLPTNYIMGSSDQSDKDDDIDAILTDTNEVQGKLPTNYIMGSSDQANVDEDIDAILTDTNEIQSKLPTNYIMGSSDQSDKDDDIDAIKERTDNLPDDPAGKSQIEAAISVSEANIRGSENDDLKDISDQVAGTQSGISAITIATAAINTRLPNDPADQSDVEAAIAAAKSEILVEIEGTPVEVWNYSDRTLTGTSSDVAEDVWSYPNRSITTEILSDESRLAKASGAKGTDAIYDLVQAFELEGSELVTIKVCDSGGSGPITDARFSLEGEAGNLLEIGWTNTDGSVVLLGNSQAGLTLDPGVYSAKFIKSLVSFEPSYSLTVMAEVSNDFTFYGAVQTITPSPDPETCLVYGNLVDFKLSPHQDVSITIHADILPQSVSDVLLTGRQYTVLSDENGDFEFYAIKTSTIKVKIDDAEVDHLLTIPDSSSVKLVDLLEQIE